MLADIKGPIWIFFGGGQQPFTRLCLGGKIPQWSFGHKQQNAYYRNMK